MAGRIRTIKPEILSDAKASRLSDAAWRLWVSAWTLADDEGRFPCDPVWLSGQVFWASPRDCSPLIDELERGGQLRRYAVNGESYAEICGWKKHQKINRPSGARYPKPGEFTEGSRRAHGGLTEGSLPSTTTNDHRPTTKTSTSTGPGDLDMGWFSTLWSSHSGIMLPDVSGVRTVLQLVRDYHKASGESDLKATASKLLNGYAAMIKDWPKPIWSPNLFVKHWDAVQQSANQKKPEPNRPPVFKGIKYVD